MSAAKARVPYASIPAAQLGTQRLRRLPGAAIRVLLYAHAVWTPRKASPMPVTRIAALFGMWKPNVTAAIRTLTTAELLTQRQPAVRPGRSGKRGSAAVFDVAGRRPGTAHRVFESGDRRYWGSFRIECAELRRLAAMLSDNEARVLVCCVLPRERDKHGVPQHAQPIPLSVRSVAAALPDMAIRSAARAIDGLQAKGLLHQVTPASGRRAATFEPAGSAASSVRRGSTSAAHHKHGTYKGVGKWHTNDGRDVPTRVMPNASTTDDAVVCHQ